MKPSELAQALECCLKIQQPVCIWGDPGIGKSDVVHQTSKKLVMDMKDIRAVLFDPVDLRGLPIVHDGRAKWAIPDFLPKEGSGILFLDELNRAPALVQNACFQLVLDRRLGEYQLPEGWTVVAACNVSGGGITKMSDALANRFVHLNVEADVQEWCKWANTHNIEPIVIAFMRFRPGLLHLGPGKKDAGVEVPSDAKAFPTPRSWAFVSRITAAHPGNGIEYGLYSGAVGEGAATEYGAFLKLFRELPSIDAILLEPKKTPVPESPATKYAIASALARRANDSNLGRILTYMERLEDEYAVLCVKDAIARDSKLQSTSEFRKWAVANQEIFS